MVIGSGTDVISGEGLIATAGGIDTHIHWISPQQVYEAISERHDDHAGRRHRAERRDECYDVHAGRMEYSLECCSRRKRFPINMGFYGKGNDSDEGPLLEQIGAGACGLKIHEDWGSTPAVIDACLKAADREDVQVCIHTDTLNESGFVDDTIEAIAGRTIHTFHTEGAGGGHCAGYNPDRRRAERSAFFHKPDHAVYDEHHRRASGYADGVPPPESKGA